MDYDPRCGQEDGTEDSPILDEPEIVDPLADLIYELAKCLIYQESQFPGAGFCDWCTCQLKFHIPFEDGCELCGCVSDIAHHTPQNPSLIISYKSSPAHSSPDAFYRLRDANTRSEGYNRAQEARKALKELTE